MSSAIPNTAIGLKDVAIASWRSVAGNVLIASGATAAVYLISYLNQAAYLHYYGVDVPSVRVSVDTLVLVGVFACLLLLPVLPILATLKNVLPPINTPLTPGSWRKKLWFYIVMEIVFIADLFWLMQIIMSTTGMVTSGLKVWLSLPALTLGLRLIVFLSKEKNADSYRQTFIKEKRKIINIDVALIVLTLLTVVGAAIGQMSAQEKDTYKLIDGNWAIISEYGNTIIAAETHGDHLTGKYRYIDLSNLDKPLDFTVKKTKLHPAN